MAERNKVALEPRKAPVQARSAASVTAILEATIQVLLQVGKEKLTTTRVAARAGVSVGTLYQYFPNKSSLLQAVLKQHLDEVTQAVESACQRLTGAVPRDMVTALIHAFLDAKLKNAKTSSALYSVSSDVDGARISLQMGLRSHRAMARMFASASETLTASPQLIATMLQGLMVGVSRKVLESGAGAEGLEILRAEMIFVACAYLDARSTLLPVQSGNVIGRNEGINGGRDIRQ